MHTVTICCMYGINFATFHENYRASALFIKFYLFYFFHKKTILHFFVTTTKIIPFKLINVDYRYTVKIKIVLCVLILQTESKKNQYEMADKITGFSRYTSSNLPHV